MKKDDAENLWAKEKTRKGRNRIGFNGERLPEIERLLVKKDWARAQRLIHRELLFNPTDHWLWFSLSLAYYEEKRYSEALACSKRAVELAPDCALALWHYAGSLYMAGQPAAAAAICFTCNKRKGPNLSGIDSVTGQIVPLFHPRRHKWQRHFRWRGSVLVGRTPTGRATIAVPGINLPLRVRLRQELIEEGVFPPA